LDAASNNSVDDIRNLIEQVRIIPQHGKYSVFVIDEVHMLSAAAFNAFLKTLEEPPHHAIFILATTEKHKIIPTILSRCQIYDFNRIKVEDGVDYLRYIATKEGVTADDEALNLIAHKADGGMRDALSMFDKAVSFCGNNLNYKDVAATLNVLDYDTYFTATDLLLAGKYVDALMLFDQILSRGFSPQIFISGLNAHMRDLLMAKGPAVALVEFTGTLVERYKQQAAVCDEQFLFNAISLLTEADGKIRQSSNQRLLVELGLMKIAGLGQKKNEGIDDWSYETFFELPDLVAPTSQPTPDVAPQAEVKPVVAPQSVAQAPKPQVAESATPEVKTKPVGSQPQKPAERPASRPSTIRQGIATLSISSLLDGEAKTATEIVAEAEAEARRVASNIDPRTEEKLSLAKEHIVEELMQSRRRFGVFFDGMTISGNVVSITVPSQQLATDILQDKVELQRLMSRLSGVTGLIEIEVVVNERVKISRPITLEDRLRHLMAKNERLKDMIERLGLDAE
jgi:DNA polymerase-3 subunit gamma/tau